MQSRSLLFYSVTVSPFSNIRPQLDHSHFNLELLSIFSLNWFKRKLFSKRLKQFSYLIVHANNYLLLLVSLQHRKRWSRAFQVHN